MVKIFIYYRDVLDVFFYFISPSYTLYLHPVTVLQHLLTQPQEGVVHIKGVLHVSIYQSRRVHKGDETELLLA